MSSVAQVLDKQIKKSRENKWYESYWLVDLHGTITRPNHDRHNVTLDLYPYAQVVLQLCTIRPDIRLILYTSSYPDQIEEYIKQLKELNIQFNYINENPEIRSGEDFGYYEVKPYFDIYLDDKAGFNPMEDWKALYAVLERYIAPHPEWSNPQRKRKSTKFQNEDGSNLVRMLRCKSNNNQSDELGAWR